MFSRHDEIVLNHTTTLEPKDRCKCGKYGTEGVPNVLRLSCTWVAALPTFPTISKTKTTTVTIHDFEDSTKEIAQKRLHKTERFQIPPHASYANRTPYCS